MNVIERAVLLCNGEEIRLDDLPNSVAAPYSLRATQEPSLHEMAPDRPLGNLEAEGLLEMPLATARAHVLASFERWYLVGILQRTNGRVGDAARSIGIDPRSLYDKLKRHGIDKKEFKES